MSSLRLIFSPLITLLGASSSLLDESESSLRSRLLRFFLLFRDLLDLLFLCFSAGLGVCPEEGET